MSQKGEEEEKITRDCVRRQQTKQTEVHHLLHIMTGNCFARLNSIIKMLIVMLTLHLAGTLSQRFSFYDGWLRQVSKASDFEKKTEPNLYTGGHLMAAAGEQAKPIWRTNILCVLRHVRTH